MKDRPKLATMTEGYYAMKMHVLVRFGRWHEIIEEPLPGDPQLYLVSTPMHHYARGIAYATLEELRRGRSGTRAVPRSRRSHPGRSAASSAISRARHPGRRREACSTARSSIIGATTSWPIEHLREACAATTISTTPSRGPGCIRRAMPWRRCCMEQGHFDGGRSDLSRRSRPERPDPALRPASRQCLGAARARRMPAAARRDRGAAGPAGEARRGPGQGRRADHLVLHVPDQGPSGRGVLRLKAKTNSRKQKSRPGTGRLF